MTRWEYRAMTFVPEKSDPVVKDYLKREYPRMDWKELPRYDALTLEAHLQQMGEEGWELVSLQLADTLGANGDLGFMYTGLPSYRRAYLGVFKRPRE